MASSKLVQVEVCWASPERQVLKSLTVPPSSTIRDVLQVSGLLEEVPQIDLAKLDVGVFSERRNLTDRVRDGDRIEVYRPLIADPKEVRRRRAGQHQAGKRKKRG